MTPLDREQPHRGLRPAAAILLVAIFCAVIVSSFILRRTIRVFHADRVTELKLQNVALDQASEELAAFRTSVDATKVRASRRVDRIEAIRACEPVCKGIPFGGGCWGDCIPYICASGTVARCIETCAQTQCDPIRPGLEWNCAECKAECTQIPRCKATWCDDDYPPRKACVAENKAHIEACINCLHQVP
jgi:hypothetical protein